MTITNNYSDDLQIFIYRRNDDARREVGRYQNCNFLRDPIPVSPLMSWSFSKIVRCALCIYVMGEWGGKSK